MSEFDRQDQELFRMVGENHRRSGLTKVVGYIVPADQAQKFAAYEAKHKRAGSQRIDYIVITLLLALMGMLLPLIF